MYPAGSATGGHGEEAEARRAVERALSTGSRRQWLTGIATGKACDPLWRELDLSVLADFKSAGFAEYHRDLVRGATFLTKAWACQE